MQSGNWRYSCSAIFLRSGIQYTREYRGGALAVRPTVPLPPILVNSIVITGGPVSGTVADQVQLTATTYDGYGNVITGQPVAWASTNTGIATVDASGLVTLITPGTVTISATSQGLTATTTATCTTAPFVANDGDILVYDTVDGWLPVA